MRTLKQIGHLTSVSLSSIPLRLGMSSVMVLSTAALVVVFLSLLAMAAGLESTIANTGRPDRAIVLSTGAQSEMLSGLGRQDVEQIVNAPGIARDADGRPVASAETVNTVALATRDGGTVANAVFRGVSGKLSEVRPEVQIIEGRDVAPAVREVIVGKAARALFRELNVGDTLRLADSDWKVVGVFTSNGDSHESEIIGSADTILAASPSYQHQTVTVKLSAATELAAFKNALTSNPQLSVDVVRENDFYRNRSQSSGSLLYVISYGVGGIMAIGAIFAGLNGMYIAIRARHREIATVRAVGFQPSAVIAAVMTEAAFLAAVGAALGIALAWLLVDGHVGRTGGGITPATLTFAFSIGGRDVVAASALAIAVGILAGLFPALRAARIPIAQGLRAT